MAELTIVHPNTVTLPEFKRLRLFCLLLLCCWGVRGYGQVVADFTASSTSGCSPHAVTFNSTSTGGPFLSYLWDFGNGLTSTLANSAGVIYGAPGTYTVTLTVSGPGGTDTKTVVGMVTVFQKPDVFIGAMPTSGCDPLTVAFEDLTIAYPGPLTALIWDFGDGVTDITPDPSHTYTAPGTYNVLLSVVDANGCAATSLAPTTILVQSPITAAFSGVPISSCGAPMTVAFTDLSTGPGPFTYLWDFGDGSPTSNAPNPVHTYLSSGSYTVLLKVENAAGCVDISVMPNYVTASPISAGFTATPTPACLGSAMSFQDLSLGFPTGWAWDFGDGSTSTLQNPTHVYGATGLYQVQLIVTRAPGCIDTVLIPNAVEVLPSPTAAFTASNNTGCAAQLTVSFTDNSTGATAYQWSFGDGNASTLANPTHIYTAPGLYTVTLVVTSANGCTDTLVQTDLVQIIPPVAAFTFTTVQSGCMPRTVMFTNTSTTTYGAITGYDWDFGDGATSNGTNPNHTYNTPGTWTVTLIVYTSTGCSDTLILPNFLTTGLNPNADFTAAPLTACVGQAVSFTDNSTAATGWLWDFGDGGTSTLPNPTHTYAAIGCYDVTLIANNNGCTDTRTRNNYVCVVGTGAGFTFAPAVACDTPATVTFINTSTGTVTGTRWDFGDPASGPLNAATTSNASHVYHAFGVYVVKLVSEDVGSGCRDSITDTVRISKPLAAFTSTPGLGCAPIPASFTNGSTGTGPLGYQWTFGDGGTSTVPSPLHNYVSAGNYVAQLITTDANGCRDTAMAALPIVVHAAVAGFTASALGGCPGDSFTFTSTSTSDSPIVSETWSYGDGSPSGAGAVTTHAYPIAGNYVVTLTVMDSNGCTRSFARTLSITHPTPSFNRADTLLCAGELFAFGTTSGGFPLLSYRWTFGDGAISLANNPTHAYAANGTYTVQMVVTDGNGCKDSISHPVTVQPPVASFVIFNALTNCPPLIVRDSSTSTGNIASLTWDFGDGSPLVNNNPTPSHIYSMAGSYAVTLIVRTPTGCADTLSIPNSVTVNAPTGTFDFDKSVTCPGQPVEYRVSPAGTYLTLWDFGDGQLLSGDTVVHAYSNSGAYPIQLLLDYTTGPSCQTAAVGPAQDSVRVLPAPIARFGLSDTVLCVADSVFFADSSSFGGGVQGYAWNFGDGGSDSVAHPSHFYSVPGTYTVFLFVGDTLGCMDGDTLVAAVRLFEQIAGFAVLPRVTCPGSTVIFNDTSYSDTTIVAWAWDFGDSTTGSTATVSHSYADTGWYDVQLVITTAAGCNDTLLLPNAVYVQQPIGRFTISTDTACLMAPVQFTFVGGSWVTPTWFFGNGDSLQGGDTVVYAYPTVGTFAPYIEMKDSLGCTATALASGLVTVVGLPSAAYLMDSTVLCAPDSVHFTDVSTYISPAASVIWDFGDGFGGSGNSVSHFFAGPGYFNITLTVVDALGCSDSVLDSNRVRIHEQIAAFGANMTTSCAPSAILFTDSSYCDTSIVAWAWSFGDGGTGSGMQVSHSYQDTGYYDVTLAITSSVGCSDTLTLPGYIDIHSPQIPEIWAATVEGDNRVAVLFHQDGFGRFASYVLWGESGPGTNFPIDSNPFSTDTVLIDPASNSLQSPACYRPMVVDSCGDSTALALTRLHCTVELLAMPGIDQNLLNWTPYVGWDSVTRYDIFAVSDYDTTQATLLASVAGNVGTWTDTTLACTQLRSYRIRAIGSVPQERSWSDSSQARPTHEPPSYVPEMTVATVANNADVAVTWSPASFAGVGDYELYRSLDGASWTSMGIVAAPAVQYLDQSASVGTQSYYYHVAVADSCGYWSPPSNAARSILLLLDGSDGSVRLSWNAYGDWGGGVARYDVEAQPIDGGAWSVMGTLPATTLGFHDTQGLPGAAGACYRVRAYESGGNLSQSQSNEVCFAMDIWVPNTLTPNGDGMNDVLTIRALAGYPGTGITVYNRWGNLVYQTDDYQNDWRGTNGNTGESLPDGTYFWVLQVSDGRQLKGYVSILR